LQDVKGNLLEGRQEVSLSEESNNIIVEEGHESMEIFISKIVPTMVLK